MQFLPVLALRRGRPYPTGSHCNPYRVDRGVHCSNKFYGNLLMFDRVGSPALIESKIRNLRLDTGDPRPEDLHLQYINMVVEWVLAQVIKLDSTLVSVRCQLFFFEP